MDAFPFNPLLHDCGWIMHTHLQTCINGAVIFGNFSCSLKQNAIGTLVAIFTVGTLSAPYDFTLINRVLSMQNFLA